MSNTGSSYSFKMDGLEPFNSFTILNISILNSFSTENYSLKNWIM